MRGLSAESDAGGV